MEEEMLEQEQQQDMPVEAPESVSEPLSQESNTMAQGQAESPVRNDSEKRSLISNKRSLLTREKKSPAISKSASINISEMVSYALKNTSGQQVNPADLEGALQSGGLEPLRQQVAVQELTQRTSLLKQTLEQSMLDTAYDSSMVAEQLQEIANQKVKKTALEEAAVTEAMLESAQDPEWAAIFAEDEERTNRLQLEAEAATLLYNYLEEKRDKAEKDFDYGVDLLRGITSLDLLSKVFGFGPDFAEGIKEFDRAYRSAESTEQRLQILNDFDKQIEEAFILSSVMDVNPDFAYEIASLAFEATPEQRSQALAMGGVEGVLTLFGWGSLAKGGFRGAKQTLGVKSPERTLESAKNGDVEAKASILTAKPPEDKAYSQYAAVQEHLEKQQRALDDTVNNLTAPVLRTEMETLPVFDKAVIARQETMADGTLVSDIVSSKGNPFARKANAERRAQQLGLSKDSYEVVDTGRGFVVRYKTERDAWNAPATPPDKVNPVRVAIDNVDNWVEGIIHDKRRMAEGAFSQVEATVRKVWKNGFGGLSAPQKRDLTRLLEAQRKANTKGDIDRWWTEDEFIVEYQNLTGNTPSPKEVVAFHTFKQLNDFAWTMDNRVLYEQALQQGFSSVKFKDLPFTVTARQGDSVADDAKVFDMNTQGTFQADELLSGKDNYDIFVINNRDMSDLMEEGLLPSDGIKYVAVPKGSAKVGDLDPIQLAYKAGGRVTYSKDTAWLKQLNVRRNPNGSSVRLRDRTMYRADSFIDAEDYAARWNKGAGIAKQARQAGADIAALRASFRDLDLGELDDFLQNADAYKWDLDEPMVAVRNRQSIPYSQEGVIDSTDELDYIIEGVGNRFSKRGQGVPHIYGEAGEAPLDPLASLSDSIDATARNAAFSSFRVAALERFKNKFGAYVDTYPNMPITAYLRASPNKKAADAGLVSTIRGHQKYLEDVMSMKTQDERMWDMLVDKATRWAADNISGDIGKTVARGIESARGFSPTAQARNIIFNAKMGLFNPATFILQALQAPVVAATVPKFGMRSLTAYPLFRSALYGSDEFNPALLREFAEKAGKVKDMEFLGDLDEAVKEFQRMGISNFGGRMAYIDSNTGNNVLGLARSSIGEKAASFADKGRVFFNEGEMIPRAVSYMAARARWLSDKKINPKGLPATSDAGRQWIHSATNKYVLGMSRADIQQGIRGGFTGVVAQFYSFVFRATAAFTGRQFTKGEKLRMATAYILLYGGAGVPFLGWALRSLGDKYNSPEVAEAAERGFVDGVMTSALGYETDMSSRAGIGQAWDDIWDMFTGDRTMMEVLGGAAGNTGSRFFDSIGDTARAFSIMQNPDLGTVTERTVLALGQQVSSFNNTYKAIQAWGTGKLVSSRGSSYMPISNAELMGQIFGVPTFKYTELDLLFSSEKKRKEAIKDAVQDILTLQKERAETDDPERKKELDGLISLVMNNMREFGLLEDVNKAVLMEMRGNTIYSSLYEKALLRKLTTDSGFVSPLINAERLEEVERSSKDNEE